MIIVVGLGNPGKAYEHTRHNAGFLALDAFAKEHGYPAFKLSSKSKAFVSESILGSAKVLLAKPQTFMNKSGASVKSLMKTKPGLVVVHDDIDIPIGTVDQVSKKNAASLGRFPRIQIKPFFTSDDIQKAVIITDFP